MEINNPTPMGPPIQPNAVIPTPSTSSPTKDDSSNKMILWLIGGVMFIFLVVGGIYWYLSSQQQVTEPTFQPTITIKPQDTVDTLDKDLNELKEDNLDSDFSSLDQDLQNL